MVRTAAILGAPGYGGAEVVRLLRAHPQIDAKILVGESNAGNVIGDLYPNIADTSSAISKLSDVTEDLQECDIVFSALPHTAGMAILPSLSSALVIDLSGDFRLDDEDDYEAWYGAAHADGTVLPSWTYGLTELFRDEIKTATRIANPGCYATAIALAFAPLVAAGLVKDTLVADAMSGTTGAGRVPKAGLHFSHVFEDVRAYKVGSHQHTPEIEAALERYSNGNASPKLSFTAHLVPMARGIQATCSAQLADGADEDDCMQAFNDAFKLEPFVRIVELPPGTKDVRGSNMAMISCRVDQRSRRVIVNSVLDNLVKGAAGQAIQNANLVFDFEETLGLPVDGLYP